MRRRGAPCGCPVRMTWNVRYRALWAPFRYEARGVSYEVCWLRGELHDLRLFVTGEYPCSYLPERWARNLVVDPLSVNDRLYSWLASQGFRRSGDHVYRPHCMGCAECLSLRVPVATFARSSAIFFDLPVILQSSQKRKSSAIVAMGRREVMPLSS